MNEKKYIITEGTPYKNLDEELKKILHDEEIESIVLKKKNVALVGSYIFDNGSVLYSFPKYMPRTENGVCEEDFAHLQLIGRTVEKLKETHKENLEDEFDYDFSPYHKEPLKRKINRIKVAEYIVRDYIEHGVYYRELRYKRKNGSGRQLWGETIRKIKPLIQQNDVVYFDKIVKAKSDDYDDMISQLHAHIVCQCIDCVCKLSIMRKVEKPEVRYQFAKDLSKYDRLLRQRINSIYSSREINLMKAMIAWCSISENYKSIGCTTNFDRVWEWVNDAIWGNVDGIKESIPPEYYVKYNEGEKESSEYTCFKGLGKAKPDTLRIIDDDGNGFAIAVLDAKYYVGEFKINNGTNISFVNGFPANADIAKQVAYLKQMRDYLDNPKISNHFLMPSSERYMGFEKPVEKEMYVKIGFAEGSIYEELRETVLKKYNQSPKHEIQKNLVENTVDVILVDPDSLYKNFLTGNKVQDEAIRKMMELFFKDEEKKKN